MSVDRFMPDSVFSDTLNSTPEQKEMLRQLHLLQKELAPDYQDADALKPGKSSASQKETKDSRVKEPRPTVAAVVPIFKDSRAQDTSSLQVATSDNISVQNGLGEVVPQEINIPGGRATETIVRVQGTDVGDQFSGGVGHAPSSEDAAMDASPLEPGKKAPRIYGGIITALTFGSLGKYEPNTLTGNALTGISHETKIGYSTGIRLVYLLGDVKNSTTSITADVMFGRMGFQYNAADTVLSTTSEKMLGQYSLATSASAFTLNALYNARIIRGTFLGISVGITTSYIFNVEHSYSVSASKGILPSASTISTSDSGRTMQYTDASTSSVNRLQFGLVGGLHYEFLHACGFANGQF